MKQFLVVFASVAILTACTNPQFTRLQNDLAQYNQMINTFSEYADSLLADSLAILETTQIRKMYEDSSVVWRQLLNAHFTEAQLNDGDREQILTEWAQLEMQWIDVYIRLEKKATALQIQRFEKSLALINTSDSLIANVSGFGKHANQVLLSIQEETKRMNDETRAMAEQQIYRATHFRDSIVGVLTERKSVLSKQPEILIR